MSNNSPIVSIRVPVLWLAAIDAQVKKNSKRKTQERFPGSRSKWILEACEQRLNHLGRSQKAKGKKDKPISE